MNAEGEYRFSNGGVINHKLEEGRKEAVSRHEAQHAELYTTTTFGQLTIMLEKNAMFHEKSNWLYKELFNYMNRMQERISVNVEYLDIFSEKGEEKYLEMIEKLKERNRNYYNHFRKLCCINGRVKSEKDALDAISILRAFGRLALNIKINEIPLEKMENESDLQKFFSDADNAAKYLPNRRFEIMVNTFFRENDKDKKMDLVIDGTLSEEMDNQDMVHMVAENKAKEIFAGSYIYDRLAARIATVGQAHYEIHCDNIEYLLTMPLDLERTDKADYVEESLNDFLERIMKEEYRDSFIMLPHSMGGFEDMHIISMFDEKTKKIYHTLVLDDELFLDAIRKIPQNLIFHQTKLFRKLKPMLAGLVQSMPVYICLENSIYQGIEFISKNFKKGYFTFLQKDAYTVFIVWRRNYIFISYIIEPAEKELETIMKEYEISYIAYEEAEIDKARVEKVADICMENMILAKNFADSIR